MKEIVFGDSVKGSLKWDQRYDERQMRQGVTGWIGQKPSQEALDRMWAGKAVGGNPKDVLGIGLMLDVGDISGADRKNVLRGLFGSFANEKYVEDYITLQMQDLEIARRAARNGEHLRIWTSAAPSAACGLRHILWEIRGCDCPTSVIELPQYWEHDGVVTHFSDWGEVSPGQFYHFLPGERMLGTWERRALANEWADAMTENAPLRTVINGKMMGVNEDFYDPILMKCMPEAPVRMGVLLGNVLGKYPLGIGDGWYARRIQNMIDRGILRVVDPGEADRPYSKILAKG